MARPRFKATPEKRKTVLALAGYGLKHEQIVHLIGIRSAKTLRKYFRNELAAGTAEANAQVARTLFQMATSGSHPGATMFWLKCRARWPETPAVEQRSLPTPTLIISQEVDDGSSED